MYDNVLTQTFILVALFAGEKLVNFLFEPKKGTKWPAKLPRFENRQEAVTVCKTLAKEQFVIRADKVGKGELEVSHYQHLSDRSFPDPKGHVSLFDDFPSSRRNTLTTRKYYHRLQQPVPLRKQNTLCGFMKETKPKCT